MQPIKTALLAYGMSGKYFHAPFLAVHPGFELWGAWERSSKKIQADFGNALSYPSLQALLQSDVELVVVNTPVDTHYQYALQALQAGKHVLVEKTFTCNAAEAAHLLALAAEKALVLTVYQNRRYDSDFKTVQKVLASGVLGPIVEAEIRFDRYRPGLSNKAWKESKNEGAGILKDLGSHIIDQALCLFGKPRALFADIRQVRNDTQVDDNIDLLLYYTDKRVRLHAGFFNREQLPGYVLQGRLGSFFKPRGDVQEEALKAGLKPGTDHWGLEPNGTKGILHTAVGQAISRNFIPTDQGNYLRFFDALYQCIRRGDTAPVTGGEALLTMQLLDAALLSNKEGRVIVF